MMLISNPQSKRTLTLFTLIIAGEAIFFLPFVIARIFRPTLLVVFKITNTELGTYFSVYGIVAMISYFFGGPLADRYPSRYLMSIALFLTGLGGFVMLLVPLKGTMIVLYAFWGFTTILLFWAALIRATREWGGIDFQGRAFGWLEGGRGLTAALLGTLALFVFSNFNPDSIDLATITSERINSFRNVILFTSIITLLSAVMVLIFVPDNKKYISREAVKLDQVLSLLKLPSIWLLAIIIVCAYVGYKITDDFSLYANEVLGFNEFKSAWMGTGALWMRAIVAIFAGFFADRLKASKIISTCFAITIIGAGLVASGIMQEAALIMILNLLLVMIGVYGIRALYFALIQEARIDVYYTGTAVGIVSVLGFTPDIFMSPWMGVLLDNNPGSAGHQKVFAVLCMFAVLGLLASLAFIRVKKSGD